MREWILRSGFTPYKTAVIVANAISKELIGEGLSFAANQALTKTIKIFSGPVVWAIIASIDLINITGSAYRVTVPAVIHVAYMRQQHNQSSDYSVFFVVLFFGTLVFALSVIVIKKLSRSHVSDEIITVGVTQLNFNILIFIDANVALHKSACVKSGS